MEIEIDLQKSVDENAGTYFELAKKAKKKMAGAKEALAETKRKLEQLYQKEEQFWQKEEQKTEKKERKQEWYEKFHWFISSEGFLCLGGKDATSNEIVIKKHVDKTDLIFHTEAPGSPFFVIKNGQECGEETLQECAQATAIYSKAWKLGFTSAEVFYVKPEQVTKEAKSGESISKGSFMVYGKKTFLQAKLEYAFGNVEQELLAGPVSVVKKKTSDYLLVVPGREKKSALAKKIKSKLKCGDLDEIIKFLPAGGADLKKVRN